MKQKILIVEDEFIVANDLRIMLEKSGYKVCGIAPSVSKALELIDSKQPDWILLDIFLQGDKTGIDLAGQLKETNLPFIYISANTNQGILEAAKATMPYGFLVKPFREKDLMVMLDIARYRHEQNQKYSNNEQADLEKQLNYLLGSNNSNEEKLKQIAASLQPLVPFNLLWITKMSPRSSTRDINILAESDGRFNLLDNERLLKATNTSSRDFKNWSTASISAQGKTIFNGYDFRKLRMESAWIKVLSETYQLESALLAKITRNDETFHFLFFSSTGDQYTKVHNAIIKQFRGSLEAVVDKIIYSREAITSPAAALKQITVPQAEITKRAPVEMPADFNGIIGNSPLLQAAFKKLELVAPDDTSVLILGESGTGKERIAQTIHQLSPRKSKPLVTVNCAALPITLIESELFGHEKGAFTGANERRIGKFEQADGGSIFLDEIGELPLEAQVKLLRVLQEKEIERLGGNQTKKINVRIITATNRNLEVEVAEGRFRLDLYYRLNVFPIQLPPLRARKDDIPFLVQHFIEKYGKRTAPHVKGITEAAIQALTNYDWPGNIRELEHLIERNLLLTEGNFIDQIELPQANAHIQFQNNNNLRAKTMEEMERDHILSILTMCKGKIYGPGGAAEILNIPSTTLNSKIKKLGIKFEFEK